VSSLRRAGAAIGAVAVSLVVGVAGFEVVSRIVGLSLPTLEDPSERAALFAYDANKGWFHTPNARSQRYIHGPDAGLVRINSLGLRGPEITRRPKPGTKRILVLGDSFAFGAGLDYPHTFSTDLSRNMGPDVEVVNLGVSGYSTDQELLLFEDLGSKLHANLVLLLMCDNDFEANTQDFVFYMNYKPYFELGPEARLIRRNKPVPRLNLAERLRLWLGRHSNTWKLLKAIGLGRRRGRLTVARPWLYDRLVVAVSRPSTPDVRLTGRLVSALRGRVQDAGAAFVVLNTGHRNEQVELFRQLRKRLDRRGIEYLALEPTLRKARQADPKGLWDFPQDTHWNIDATALAARTVAAFLRRRGLNREPLPQKP
jgi:hypothetical protein